MMADSDVAPTQHVIDELSGLAQRAVVQRRWSDALEYWSRLCTLRPGELGFELSRAEICLRLHRFEEASAVFEAVRTSNPNEMRAIVGLLNIAEARLDRDAALGLLRRGVELYPHASGAVRKMVRLLVEMGRSPEAEAVLADHAPRMGPVDLLLAKADLFKTDRGAALMSLVEEHADLVAQDEALRDNLLPALLEIADARTAVSIWLGPTPSEARQAKGQVMIAVRGTDWADAETVRLLHGLWKTFGSSAVGWEDFSTVCSAIVTMEGTEAALAMLRSIDERPVVAAGDIKLKMLATFERAALGACEDPRAAILDMVVRHESDLPLGGLRAAIEGLITRFDTLAAGFSAVHLDTGLNRRSARAVLDHILAGVEQSRPLSFIRLGDSEGMLLPYPALYREHSPSDRDATQTHQWGAPCLDRTESEDIASDLVRSVQRADIVGIFDFQFWCTHLPVPTTAPLHLYGKFYRGMLSVMDNSELYRTAHVDHVRTEPRLLTSTVLPFDFETHGLFEVLFSAVRNVSLITCHARLAPYLQDRFGVSIGDVFLIPQHAKHNVAFGYDRSAEQHYPQVFDRLKRELPRQGSKCPVTLVAAGVLGKLYCDWIKQGGGIAIDIGSLADYWCGFSTRHQSHSRVRRAWRQPRSAA